MAIKLSDLISQKEAAELRGVTIQAIAHLIKAGRFTTVEVGGRTMLLRKEVLAYKPKRAGRPRKKPRTKKRR